LPKDEEWSDAVGLKNELGNTPEEWQDKAVSVEHPTETGQKLAAACWSRELRGEEAKNWDWP
jgi:hypothetical protein